MSETYYQLCLLSLWEQKTKEYDVRKYVNENEKKYEKGKNANF